MNRISVLFAAGALGAAALTAGCSSSASKNAGAGGASTPGGSSSVASTSSPATGQNPDAGSGSTSATSSAAGTTPNTGTVSSSAPSSAPTHAAGSACTTTEMPSGTWRTVPDSEGAGHVAADIAFQNTSSHTCTVAGFPGVSLLASNDHSLPTNVLKDTSVAVTSIKVAPGAWVHAEMRYSPNVPGPGEPQSGGQCEPMTVHALAQLPGDSAWAHVTLDSPTPVCEKGELQVKPFVSGQSSPNGG